MGTFGGAVVTAILASQPLLYRYDLVADGAGNV
jgi:hypothetical protein